MVIVPLGYTVSEVFASGGNPYGASYTSGDRLPGRPTAEALGAAHAQGARLARYADVIAAAHAAGELPKPGGALPFPAPV
jgi:NAD(P)H dehydrogenase (quinone)